MAGTKPGPAPTDPEVRQRTNSPAPADSLTPDDMPAYVDTNPVPPTPPENWHSLARDLYNALLTDPARIYMTSADWALSMLVLESVSRDMKPQVVATIPATVDSESGTVIPGEAIKDVIPMNGARMAQVLKWAALINLTDAARRSVGLSIKLGVTTDDLKAKQEDVVTKRADLYLVAPDEEVG